MFVADEGVAAVREDLVVWLVGRFANRPTTSGWLDGSLDRNGCVGGLVGRAAPLRALTPTLSRPTGEGDVCGG